MEDVTTVENGAIIFMIAKKENTIKLLINKERTTDIKKAITKRNITNIKNMQIT